MQCLAIVFDFVVLVLSATGLRWGGSPWSPLQTLVFKQGLLYFVSAFTANLLPVVSSVHTLRPRILI